MLKEKELIVLGRLRQNSRESLAMMNRETGIPVSTLADLVHKLEESVIVKHVCLLDYLSLGYGLRVSFVMSSREKAKLREHLTTSQAINSVFLLMNGQFYVECVFRDMAELISFKEQLEQFSAEIIEQSFVVEELKREGFSV